MHDSLKTAVAFIIFNRPEMTKEVFQRIRQARPRKLFLIADGPREGHLEDHVRCLAARKIAEAVDWPCEVFKDYSEINLGCGVRPASGINWVFDHVEEAIILEDDCLPHPTFFRYCDELLDYYRHDTRIMMISGDNFQFQKRRSTASYYFSRFAHCTGWATWRRAWKHFDHDLKLIDMVLDNGWLEGLLPERRERRYWLERFKQAKAHKREIWDYHWTFAIWIQGALTVIPEVNLITNIGYNSQGTHTKSEKDLLANLPTEPMEFPLHHPDCMIRNVQADKFTTDVAFIHSKLHAVKFIAQRFLLEKVKRRQQKISSCFVNDGEA